MNIRVLVTLESGIHKKLTVLAKKNFMTTTAFMRQVLSEAAVGNINKNEIPEEAKIKKRKSKNPVGSVKEWKAGRFRDSLNNEFIEDKNGIMIPYDIDNDSNITDI